jgi:hypothetical protein
MDYVLNDRAPSARPLRRSEAAQYISETYGFSCSEKTLAKLACVGGGPAFRKAGRIPLYAASDLDDWAHSKMSPLVRSTSELSRSAA